MEVMKFWIRDGRTGKLRARKVDARRLWDSAATEAEETGEAVIDVAHGGTVAKSYGYKASTESVFVVALPPDGDFQFVFLWGKEIPACGATLCGAAAVAGEDARMLFHKRASEESKQKAREAVIKMAKELVPKMIIDSVT